VNRIRKSLRLLNWVKSKALNHAVILGYHRISNASRDPYLMNVTPENFSEQLDIIKKYAVPITLSELVEKIEKNKINEKYVALTFDDGYADNYYRAKPILEKHSIPATVFVSSGKLNQEFWWDELERLVLTSEIHPEELHIRYQNGSFFWQYDAKEKIEPNWSLFRALYKLMHGLEESRIYEILNQLKGMMDQTEIDDPRYRVMNRDELLLLNSGSLIDIGSHSVSHKNLKHAKPDQLREEIKQSKKDLENILQGSITGFSFPFGSVTPGSHKLLRETGYNYACVSFSNYTFNTSDKYSLPRFWVPDYSASKFEKWLNGWRN